MWVPIKLCILNSECEWAFGTADIWHITQKLHLQLWLRTNQFSIRWHWNVGTFVRKKALNWAERPLFKVTLSTRDVVSFFLSPSISFSLSLFFYSKIIHNRIGMLKKWKETIKLTYLVYNRWQRVRFVLS